MNAQQYTNACLMFAEATKDWGSYDSYSFYTSTTLGGFLETCDNAHNGIDVTWAFHKDENYIRQHARKHYIQTLIRELEQALDDDWNEDQIDLIVYRE